MVDHPIPYINYYLYENANYILLRLLLPIYTRTLAKEVNIYNLFPFTTSELLDSVYDLLSKIEFQKYLHKNILFPAGIPHTLYNADMSNISELTESQKNNKAYAYQYQDKDAIGWDTGNLSSHPGTIGLRMSVNELLSFLFTLRQTEKILSKAEFKVLIDNNWGIKTRKFEYGIVHYHNGWWESSTHQVEQSAQYMLPNGYDLVALGNSSCNYTTGKTGSNFEEILFDTINYST